MTIPSDMEDVGNLELSWPIDRGVKWNDFFSLYGEREEERVSEREREGVRGRKRKQGRGEERETEEEGRI